MRSKFLKRFVVVLLISFSFVSCDKTEDIPVDIEVQDFVWKGMNAFYLWQDQVPDLADTRFSTQGQLNDYLQGFADPRDLFQSILFQPGVVDRFSVIVDDYIALENSFQGINLSNGMEFGLVRYANDPSNIFGYVRYVVPNSDAETQGVTRGMIFTEVDGVQLTDSNFGGLLFGSNTNYTITLATYNNGNPIANSTTISLTKTQLQENPLHIVKTLTDGANKVGYLMYNQFASSFDGQLNDAFAFFQSENITDLIIDLRYNGGGSVRTATFLGGMVTGQFNGQLYSREVWNSKVQAAIDESNFINNFTNQLDNGVVNEPINNLNLNRVYFITTGSTASASELVMNSLSSYIEVNSVGTRTVGKVRGSVTLYDSDNFTRSGDNLNPNHTWAIQPLVLEIVNANGTNAPDGIVPNVDLPEDFGNLGVLGERSDPLLDRTMILITTGSRSSFQTVAPMDEVSNSQLHTLSSNNMHQELKVKN
jgi:C-terminal processing protease CtpA/Prc